MTLVLVWHFRVLFLLQQAATLCYAKSVLWLTNRLVQLRHSFPLTTAHGGQRLMVLA